MAHVPVRRGGPLFILLILAIPMSSGPHTAAAQDRDAEIEALKEQIQELIRLNAEQQRQIERLHRKVEDIEGRPTASPTSRTPAAALDEAVEAAEQRREDKAVPPLQPSVPPTEVWARQVGGGRVRLIDVSFDVLTAGGTSTAPREELRNLQGGAHDPNRRGFTLQQGELSLSGAVDPYLSAESHIIFSSHGVELEEAFFTTQSLPLGLQLEGGYFFTEFGLTNPLHPHAWHWIDQPIINSRLLGGEGLRSPGFRLGWLTPLPWFSELHFGMQNADEGETTLSFISDEGVGGRPAVDRGVESLPDLLYLGRWNNSWDLSDEWTALLGFSGLYGPNATGNDGRTWIYGTDLKVRWRPRENFRGWPFLTWQSEAMKRDYTADFFLAGTAGDPGNGGHTHGDESEEEDPEEFDEDLPGAILRDWGLYTQLLYGFRYRWASGVRFEYASGHGASLIEGELTSRSRDPFRDDRYRLSPLLVWQPTEYSRFRLQYNYDNAPHLEDGEAHTVWLGAEVFYGAHPAHKY